MMMMVKFSRFVMAKEGVKKLVQVLFPPNPQQTIFASRHNSLPVRTPVHCVHLNIEAESQHRSFQLYPQLMKVISKRHQTPTSSPCPGKSVCSFLVSIDQSLRVESAEPDTKSRLSAAQATFKHQHGSPFERHSIAFVCLLFCSLVS